MLSSIGGACVVLALVLDSVSYWKQIAKTIRTGKSTQVSSSQYLYKIGKAICATVGLALYANWVGVIIETFMLFVYIISLIVVIKYKPKGWTLWGRVQHARKKTKVVPKHRHTHNNVYKTITHR